MTSEKRGGSSRGTTALRTTPYAFDATSTPSAAGYSSRPPVATAPDSISASSARASIAPAIAARRPCGSRSSSGPITGASRVNGAMVMREVERDPAAGLVRGHREEDRGGERDGDHHVAGAVHPVQLDQLAEAGLARAVRVRGLADAARRCR